MSRPPENRTRDALENGTTPATPERRAFDGLRHWDRVDRGCRTRLAGPSSVTGACAAPALRAAAVYYRPVTSHFLRVRYTVVIVITVIIVIVI